MAEAPNGRDDDAAPDDMEEFEPSGDSATEGSDEFATQSFEPAVLRDRYVINPQEPLPDFDQPSAKAYAATDRRNPERELFALICTPGLPTRTDAMNRLKGLEVRGMLPLIDWDSVLWPPFDRRTMAVIYVRPAERLMQKIENGELKINEYDMSRRVIEPLAKAISDLDSLGVAHREIRPQNLFCMDPEANDIVLGDCVTSPAGFDQPPLFEPLERALASPAGRGPGSVVDDIFSFGAALVVLFLGTNPLGRVSEDEMLYRRIEQGSYAAICGGARVPLSLLEPLRGMLSDDPLERWGIDQLDLWLNGRKMTPIQKRSAPKAETPLRFAGRDHITARTLAHAFSKRVSDAGRLIKEEHFHAWLKRGIGDALLADSIRGLADQAKFHQGTFQGSDEFVVCKACMLLDPSGPIRYKGLSFTLDGYGSLLAVEMLRDGDAQSAAECLAKELPQIWFTLQTGYVIEAANWQRLFGQLKGFLTINEPGYGIERVLYELNPSLPCQSPLIVREHAMTPGELMPALDDAANQADTQKTPLDRHIVAFIAARFNEDIHPHLRALASPKVETQVIGMLSLLAFLQWKLRIESCYGLASWVGGLLGPAINTYHNRPLRREIERDIPRLVRKGSLPELFDLIDNAEKRREDLSGFEEAKAQYAEMEDEVRDIEGAGSERLSNAERAGQQSAAMISVISAMIVVVVVFLMESW